VCASWLASPFVPMIVATRLASPTQQPAYTHTNNQNLFALPLHTYIAVKTPFYPNLPRPIIMPSSTTKAKREVAAAKAVEASARSKTPARRPPTTGSKKATTPKRATTPKGVTTPKRATPKRGTPSKR